MMNVASTPSRKPLADISNKKNQSGFSNQKSYPNSKQFKVTEKGLVDFRDGDSIIGYSPGNQSIATQATNNRTPGAIARKMNAGGTPVHLDESQPIEDSFAKANFQHNYAADSIFSSSNSLSAQSIQSIRSNTIISPVVTAPVNTSLVFSAPRNQNLEVSEFNLESLGEEQDSQDPISQTVAASQLASVLNEIENNQESDYRDDNSEVSVSGSILEAKKVSHSAMVFEISPNPVIQNNTRIYDHDDVPGISPTKLQASFRNQEEAVPPMKVTQLPIQKLEYTTEPIEFIQQHHQDYSPVSQNRISDTFENKKVTMSSSVHNAASNDTRFEESKALNVTFRDHDSFVSPPNHTFDSVHSNNRFVTKMTPFPTSNLSNAGMTPFSKVENPIVEETIQGVADSFIANVNSNSVYQVALSHNFGSYSRQEEASRTNNVPTGPINNKYFSSSISRHDSESVSALTMTPMIAEGYKPVVGSTPYPILKSTSTFQAPAVISEDSAISASPQHYVSQSLRIEELSVQNIVPSVPNQSIIVTDALATFDQNKNRYIISSSEYQNNSVPVDRFEVVPQEERSKMVLNAKVHYDSVKNQYFVTSDQPNFTKEKNIPHVPRANIVDHEEKIAYRIKNFTPSKENGVSLARPHVIVMPNSMSSSMNIVPISSTNSFAMPKTCAEVDLKQSIKPELSKRGQSESILHRSFMCQEPLISKQFPRSTPVLQVQEPSVETLDVSIQCSSVMLESKPVTNNITTQQSPAIMMSSLKKTINDISEFMNDSTFVDDDMVPSISGYDSNSELGLASLIDLHNTKSINTNTINSQSNIHMQSAFSKKLLRGTNVMNSVTIKEIRPISIQSIQKTAKLNATPLKSTTKNNSVAYSGGYGKGAVRVPQTVGTTKAVASYNDNQPSDVFSMLDNFEEEEYADDCTRDNLLEDTYDDMFSVVSSMASEYSPVNYDTNITRNSTTIASIPRANGQFDVKAVLQDSVKTTQMFNKQHLYNHHPVLDEKNDYQEKLNKINDTTTWHQNEVSNIFENSGLLSTATTMTFDSNNSMDNLLNPSSPRLTFASRHRNPRDNESMKEICLATEPGTYTTVAIKFCNKKSSSVTLFPTIIQTRFDEIKGNAGYVSHNDDNNLAFQVSPHRVKVLPGEETAFYITFSPKIEYEGIYSGALKIKSKKKNFMMLLRGESFASETIDYPLLSHERNITTDANVQTFEKSVQFDELKTTKSASTSPLHLGYSHDVVTQVYPYSEKNMNNVELVTMKNPSEDVEKIPSSPDMELQELAQRQQEVKELLSKIKSSSKGSVVSAIARSSPISNEKSKENNVHMINNIRASIEEMEQPKLLSKKSRGVFFRLDSVQFGAIQAGTLSRLKLELCNSTDKEVKILLSDPALPFVLIHNEVVLRPQSYVRLPIRFIPSSVNEFISELMAQTCDGSYHTSIVLRGSAF